MSLPDDPIIRRLRRLAAGTIIGLALALPASALDMNQALERTETIKKYQGALASADKVTGLVLVEEGLKSDDQQIVKVAFEFALGNKDKDYKDLAIKHWWSGKTGFLVRLIPPQTPTPEQKAYLTRAPNLPFATLGINEKGEPTAYGWIGSFTDGGFEIHQGRGTCTVFMSDVTAKFMTGTLVCGGMDPIAARIDLE